MLHGWVLPKLEAPLFVAQSTITTAIVLSVVLGLVSGLAPSIGAAKLKIVEALRRHD
jgi:ABC-type antimicrobial peptide transport system permease subunit